MLINLPTGKVIYVSVDDFLFRLKEEDVDQFYQSCIADDLGEYIDFPFASQAGNGSISLDDQEPPEDLRLLCPE